MSFSKAKLKRFNDIDVITVGSPSTIKLDSVPTMASIGNTPTSNTAPISSSASAPTSSSSSSSTAHSERKDQIEKFFKDAVRFASSTKEPKEPSAKDDKKSKGLRLFRTPSLPHRLRFRQNSTTTNDIIAAANNNNNGNATTSTPLPPHHHHHHNHNHQTVSSTPIKEQSKSANRLKGKEALQHELRTKNELIENYVNQIDVLKRHVEQLKNNEAKLQEEHQSITRRTDTVIHELTAENRANKQFNEQLTNEKTALIEKYACLEAELKNACAQHADDVEALKTRINETQKSKEELEQQANERARELDVVKLENESLKEDVTELRKKFDQAEQELRKAHELLQNVQNTNESLNTDLAELKLQIKQDALGYAQESKIIQNEMECLKKERNTLKIDLANKCELIRSLQDELLDKSCEIDAHCDNIRQLCRENAKYVERERLMQEAEERVRSIETEADEKIKRLEAELQAVVEREKNYWLGELEKRQKHAENEIIKIELEKQDVMVLLESTNDMLRERDEKIQKYEEQLRNGIDYYIQLTDSLQKQVVDLKQDVAKVITEKYNYQLTLSNTRSTVNILMERLKKSDADVERLKNEKETVELAKSALEQTNSSLQEEMKILRSKLDDTESALQSLRESAKALQKEVSLKETMFNQMLTSEEETLVKFNKIASSFQDSIDSDAVRYLELYNQLRQKDEHREIYMQDMKKALDDFANVLQFAQIELDNKDKTLLKLREETEQLKLENISLKSKIDEGTAKKENSTDMEKIEGMLIDRDTELRTECEKITSWLLSSAEKSGSVRNSSSAEVAELLKPTTPNNKTARNCTTPVLLNSSVGKTNGGISSSNSLANTPRTPRTPHTPRSTPKKKILFAAGKENIPQSPQKQILKARNA